MSLVPSLLQAIVSVDGEALVMHASEKPYVVSPAGQVELSSGGLTLDAVAEIVSELLPAEFQRTLDEFGAVQYTLPPQSDFPREQFTVIAARGGDDVWAEIRRRRLADEDHLPAAFFAPVAPAYVPSPSPPLELTIAPQPVDRPAVVASALRPDDSSEMRDEHKDRSLHSTGVVLAMARSSARAEDEPASPPATVATEVERLLRVAVAQGASILYVSSHARPSIRVDGTMHVLEQEPVLVPAVVSESLASFRLAGGRIPERASAEWSCDVDGIGHVRCMTFVDHRGPGAVFRLVPPIMSAEQLGLSREVQALAACREGLVLVAGPRSSGKRTLLAAFVDLINRTRCDHVITVERQVGIVHASGGSLVSQREVGPDEDDLLMAARAAAREDPDVLVLEEITTPRVAQVALTASANRLVIAGVAGHHADDAIACLIALCGAEGASRAAVEISERLRGVVAQMLLPKIGGGRVAAREVLLNTSDVAAAIAEERLSHLRAAIVDGRGHGMELLDDGLLVHVQNQIVDVQEASRHARDRDAFLASLERQGIDTATRVRTA